MPTLFSIFGFLGIYVLERHIKRKRGLLTSSTLLLVSPNTIAHMYE